MFAEDLHVGLVVDLGSHRVSEEEIITFASAWDPQLMHVDPEAARGTPLGGLIASGIHTIAVFQRLHVDGLLGRTAVIAGRGMRELRIPVPTRAGDVLTGRVEIVELHMRPHRHDAVVVTHCTLTNQKGETAFEMTGDVLIASRPPGLE